MNNSIEYTQWEASVWKANSERRDMALPTGRKPLDSHWFKNWFNENMGSTSDVTRVEIIEKSGRVYTNYDCKKVVVSFQDNNKTLKIFINDE